MRIRDVYPGSRIPDPKTATKDRSEKIIFAKPFFVATNFTKLNIILFLICWRKKIGPIFQELLKFLSKKLSPSPQKYGFGIRDPGSGKNLFRIPDPGVKKAPDPGSGSATLLFRFLSDTHYCISVFREQTGNVCNCAIHDTVHVYPEHFASVVFKGAQAWPSRVRIFLHKSDPYG